MEAPVNLSHGTADANPSVLLNPQSQDVAAALALFGAKVLSAVAFKSGTLRLVFDTGHHLTYSPDPAFETWQVAGPTGWRFASLPGGDLAVWSGSGASESQPRHGMRQTRDSRSVSTNRVHAGTGIAAGPPAAQYRPPGRVNREA
ncbi:DUF6188 family protein [Streptomyces tendae]